MLVERIAGEENIDILIREQLVLSMDLARELQFPGSPTVRIAGMDIESGTMEAAYGMG